MINSLKTVLVVDNTPDNIFNIQHLLDVSLPEYKIKSAANAAEGLQLVETTSFDLAIIDVQLPDMSGIEMCRHLKNKKPAIVFPIILVSAHKSDSPLHAEGLQAGADDIIIRPIDNIEFIVRIKIMLRLKQTGDQLRQTNVILKSLVSEKKQSLRESESKYRYLLESLNEGILVIDQNACTTFVNPLMAEMLGYTIDEMLGKHIFSFMDEDEKKNCQIRLERRQKGIREEREFVLLRKDGTPIYTKMHTSPITDSEGNYSGTIAGIIDITGRKRAEEVIRTSAQFQRAILDGLSAHIAVIDDSGLILAVNQAWRDFAAANPPIKYNVCEGGNYFLVCESAKGHESSEAIQFVEAVRTILNGGLDYYEQEYTCHSPNEERWFCGRVTPLPGKNIRCVVIAHENITKQKQLESALKKNEERYRLLFDNMLDGFAYCKMLFEEGQPKDFVYLKVNKAFERLTGLKDVVGKKVTEVVPGIKESNPELFEIFSRVALTGKPERVSVNIESLGVWLLISVYSTEKGSFVTVFDNITEQKQIEDALVFLLQCGWSVSGEDFFYSLARFLSEFLKMDYVCIDQLMTDNLSAQTVAIYNQGQFEDNVAYTLKDTPCGDVVGKTICCFPENVCSLFPRDSVLLDLKAESYIGTTLWSAEGHPIGLIAIIGHKPIANPQLAKSVLQLAAVRAAGELERRQAEEALKKSEERLRQLLESVTDYIYTVTIDNGKPVSTSHGPGCITVTGYTPEEFNTDSYLWYRIVHEEDRNAVENMAAKLHAGETVQPLGHRLIHKNGSVRWVRNTSVLRHDSEGRLIAYDGLILDITEHHRLEEQLRQAQKMEAIGQLAGGIAHDFNNILGAIFGYSHLASSNLQTNPEETRHCLEMLLKAADRAKNLVRQILTFSRKSEIARKPIPLASLVKEAVKMMRASIPATIDIRQNIFADSAMIQAEPTQMHQVLMNLCTNANHAMRETGGVLEISLTEEEILNSLSSFDSEIPPGKYVCLKVSDTGHGIEPVYLDRIFDPFFTTKDKSEGTGLGLSVVLGIVKSHHGLITCRSTVGKGTFIYYLYSNG